MTREGRIVSIDQLGSEIGKILDEIISEDLQDKCGKVAYEIVKEYRPKLKAKAKQDIKSKRNVHVNNFVSVPKKDGMGFYGAVLWNKQYTLSHLVEDSHYIWGGHTHNDYHFWKEIAPKMNEEFSKRCREAVQKALEK